MTRASLAAWLVGTAVLAALLGSETDRVVTSLNSSAAARRAMARPGGHGTFARTYLGASFRLLALLVLLVAARQIAGIRPRGKRPVG